MKTTQDDAMLLIAKHLAGETDVTEEAELLKWIGISKANEQYFEQVRNIWEASDKQFNAKSINTKSALQKVLGITSASNQKISIWIYWQKVAAVLLIPLLAGNIFWFIAHPGKVSDFSGQVYNEVYAAFGTRSALKLADGSLVWLNSGSSLKYPDKFKGKQREVFLNGEAYFEVKSDVSKPFLVQTQTLNVKATGTKFGVSDYRSSGALEVTLVSGKVYVNKRSNNGKDSMVSELKPSQHLVYDKQSHLTTVKYAEAYKYIAWKDGKLIFHNEPLKEVVKKISQLYNVDIELQGNVLRDYRYRATFQDESLDEILKLLKLSSPLDFRELKRSPLPDGSFPKKRVVIFPAKHTMQN